MNGDSSGARPVTLGIALATYQMTARLLAPATHETLFAEDVVLNGVGAPYVIEQVQYLAQRCASLSQVQSGQASLVAIGVSIGGHVNQARGEVVFAPGLISPDDRWDDEPLAKDMSEATGVPVTLDNDADCMAAYHWTVGAGRDCRNFAAVYMAPNVYGLGCGLVVEGNLVRGASGGAGEFGHTVVQPDGPRCRCTNRGCLQAVLHMDNFVRDINWGRKQLVHSFDDAAVLVTRDHERAKQAFARAGTYLGQGLATLINLVNPERIILGGPTELVATRPADGSSASLFMSSLHSTTALHAFGRLYDACEIVVAPLNLEIAALGAAYIASIPALAAHGIR
ncbi:MAG TPA: ROK family protein [Mycobacterium sp.]|nr:ROK family protein [Mycobacterium sp.]